MGPLLGNICENSNKSAYAFVYRPAGDVDNGTVLTSAFKFVRLKLFGQGQPLVYLSFNIPFAILSPSGVKPKHLCKSSSRFSKGLRKLQQINKRLVSAEQYKVAIKNRDSLAYKVKRLKGE